MAGTIRSGGRNLRAAAAAAAAPQGGQTPEEMPSEEERAVMDAAAAEMVAKLDAAYERMEPDEEMEGEMGPMDLGFMGLEDESDGLGATGRRGRRRKPKVKEIPIELLPKASTCSFNSLRTKS